MKQYTKYLFTAALGASLIAGFLSVRAEDKNGKPKPYPLTTCITDGEKLGSMGKPYVFVHEGQEIKLCCDGCLGDFKKEPAKYLKKIEEAQKKEKR